MALVCRRRNVVQYDLKKIKTCPRCTYQIERLVVWIIQIDVLQLSPMLRWVFRSGFGWLAVGHGEGVWQLLGGGVVGR